jgi:hypothetical protein
MTSIRSSASWLTFPQVTDREVWIKAGAIVAEYGSGAAAYIITRVCDDIGDIVAVQNWRRVANAVDAIADAPPQ